MRVVCPDGLPVHVFRWRMGSASYVTVVAKATFTLAQGRSALAPTQRPVRSYDEGGGDFEPHAHPPDFVPFKPRAEVLVVGSAWSGGRAASSLDVRVAVGDVDKQLVAHADRRVTRDGEVVEGPAATRLSLGWQRAAGGPDTRNPVGVGPHQRDGRGDVPVPGLLPPGVEIRHGDQDLPTVGLGPIPASWPARASLLARTGAPTRQGDDLLIPQGIEPSYYLSAPPDQLLSGTFEADPRLVLQHLHPEHERLVTNLEPMHVLARVQTGGTQEVRPMPADTLVIDTDQRVATLTYRVSFAVPAGQAVDVVVRAGARREDLTEAPEPPRATPSAPQRDLQAPLSPLNRFETTELSLRDLESHIQAEATSAPEGALPFRAMGGRAPAPVEPAVRSQAKTQPAQHAMTGQRPPEAPLSGANDALPGFRPPAAMQAPTQSAAPSVAPPPVAPPAMVPLARSSVPAAPAVAPSSPTHPPPITLGAPLVGSSESRVGGMPSAMEAIRPEIRRIADEPTYVPSAGRKGPAPDSALEASNLASGTAAGSASPTHAAPREPRVVDGIGARNTEPIDLLWVDPKLADELRDHPAFRGAADQGKRRRGLLDRPPPADREDQQRRADVVRALLTTAPTEPGGFDAAHVTASESLEGARPPLVVVSGELTVRFDELEMLRAMVGVAAPFGALDKGLRESIEFAQSVADSEWSGPRTIEAAATRVRDALGRASREMSPSVVDAVVQRKLLERRRFRSLTLLGSERLRFDFATGEGRTAVPAYLPAALRDEWPLFERLPVRAIAELRRRQDAAEAHGDALVVRALARRLPAPGRPG